LPSFSGNTNNDNELPRNTLDRNDLAFSDFSVGLRPFAPVFGLLRCNDTRNVTRRERLPSVSRRNSALVNSVASLRSKPYGVWTKPLARRTLRIGLARSAG
jgi:hypothetical protein